MHAPSDALLIAADGSDTLADKASDHAPPLVWYVSTFLRLKLTATDAIFVKLALTSDNNYKITMNPAIQCFKPQAHLNKHVFYLLEFYR
jgi:hypothetical protein